jgi:hypothetical protein
LVIPVKDEMKKEIIKCVCGRWTKPKIFRIEGLRIRGSECSKCGEGYFNPHDAYMLSEYRRIKDAILEGKITKTGNSFAVRLPIELVRAFGLEKGETVNLKVKSPKELLLSVN